MISKNAKTLASALFLVPTIFMFGCGGHDWKLTFNGSLTNDCSELNAEHKLPMAATLHYEINSKIKGDEPIIIGKDCKFTAKKSKDEQVFITGRPHATDVSIVINDGHVYSNGIHIDKLESGDHLVADMSASFTLTEDQIDQVNVKNDIQGSLKVLGGVSTEQLAKAQSSNISPVKTGPALADGGSDSAGAQAEGANR